MTQRLDYRAASPEAYRAMERLHKFVEGCGLEHSLLEFVKIRASQINRCAYCLAMHARDARKAGETELRLDLLPAWREASCYTPRERAALAMTEAMTLISRRRRAGRCLRGGAQGILGGRAGQARGRDRADQRLEPALRRVPERAGGVRLDILMVSLSNHEDLAASSFDRLRMRTQNTIVIVGLDPTIQEPSDSIVVPQL